jgi:hypothetical protein
MRSTWTDPQRLRIKGTAFEAALPRPAKCAPTVSPFEEGIILQELRVASGSRCLSFTQAAGTGTHREATLAADERLLLPGGRHKRLR